MPDSIGNTLNDARSIIIGTTAKRFSDSVEFGDNDYFRFTLNSASGFNLTLSGLSANANVELLNGSGAAVTVDTVTQRSANEGTLVESLNTILAAGTYYIRVFPGAPTDPGNPSGTTPSTNYNLDIRADNGISNDIVWRNYVEGVGNNAIWRLDGTSFVSADALLPFSDSRWRIVGSGDFNGDNTSDLIWRFYGTNPGSTGGFNSIWFLNGSSLGSVLALNPEPDINWRIVGAADFDGTGLLDILWNNPVTGENRVWFINASGNTTGVASLPNLGAPWELQAFGDFNGDRRTDLVWRNGGTNVIWFMNGTSLVSFQAIVPEENVSKRIQGAGDFNGDGNVDLLWRNYSTGANEVWLMEGASRASIVPILGVSDTNWQAITPYRRLDPLSLFDVGGSQNSTALALGSLNGNGIYRDEITATDTDDFYQFSLGSRTRLNLLLDGLGTNALQGNLNVQITSGSGTIIAESSNSGSAPEAISNLDLNPGTYFVRVFAGQAGAASAYDLDLTVNNLPVLASSGPLTVSEGQSQTLSNSLLLVTDENDPPANLVYTLVTPPTVSNGSLLSNGAALIANSTFTQADINSGRLVYQQNGGESTLDTFVFALSDGRGGTIPNTTFSINIVPGNDPPILRSLNPVTVTESQSATIGNTSLLVTDVEQQPGQIVYSLSSLPTLGALSLNAGASSGPLTLGNTFTQADIDGNRLTYRQNGTEAEPNGLDRFTFVATDGAGGFLNPQAQTLTLSIQPSNDPPALITNAGLTVTQAGPNVISSTLLRATDAEFTSLAQQDLIKYSVTQLPTQGTLFLNATPQTSLFTFSQADLNAGVVQYSQSGTPVNSDRFNFRLSDGTATVPGTGDFTFEVFVQRVPGPPVLETTNPSLTLSEGATSAISNTILRVTDPDSAAPFITFTVGSTPTTGTLLRLGTALSVGQTFTQSDIDNGRIEYRNSGNDQPLTDRFTFTFTDERGTGPATPSTFNFSITPVNDLPTILTSVAQLTVTEGLSVDFTPNLLQVTDPDNQPQDIVYTITPPTNGSLFRFGTTVTTFTQADLAGGQIKYIQNGTEAVSDSFTFTVADPSNTPVGPGTVNLTVIPFNDAPGVSLLDPITLDEGATSTITDASLLITDNDGPGPLVYTVGAAPANGILRRGNVTLSTGGTFSQADVTNGQLFYLHSGGENTSDRFTFTASDGATTGLGAPGLIGERTFSISVTPVNDLPNISVNTGLTLSEGAVGVINTARLQTTDPDNITSDLVYNVASGPASGTLLSAGVAVTTFTQSQIDGNLITYRHNGGETTLDAFVFEVSDGQGTTGSRTFNISINPVNDIPTVVVNAGLPVDEGGSGIISDAELLLTDPDGPSPSVIFTLGAAPSRGSLIREGVTLSNGQTFTQEDITGGLLSYTNNGNDPVANDRFTFTASDGTPTGTLALRTFSLTVSPINDVPVISAPTSVTVGEERTFTFTGNSISVADPDGGPTFAANIVASSGTISLSTTTGLANLSGNGSSSVTFNAPFANLNSALNNLRYRGNQDISGIETIVINVDDGNGGIDSRTITVNVTAVNDAPTLTVPTGTVTVLEDQQSTPLLIQVADVDADSTPIRVTLSATNGTVTVNDPGTLTFIENTANGRSTVTFTGLLTDVQSALAGVIYQGNPDYFGPGTSTDRITVTVNDQGATGTPGPLSVTSFINVRVEPVNDRPTFIGTNSVINLNEADTSQPVTRPIATNIFQGAANENQSLSFTIVPSAPTDLFAAAPAISISGTTANLTFTPRVNANGTVTLSALLVDSGGTGNGGQNTSDPFVFVIEVNQVNDAPSFRRGTVPATNEDSGPITINNWATNISVGPSTPAANESTQTPTFTFSTSNPSLFASGPEIVNLTGNTAALTYTPAPDANGVATVTVTLRDDGGIENGGQDTAAPQSFTINVRPVNDAPTFTQLLTDIPVLEDDPQQSVQIASDIVVGPFNELTQTASFTIAGNSNPSLFLAAAGGIAPTITPEGFITFKTAANAFGSAVLSARLVDSGGTQNGGVNQSPLFTFTINATPVNDAPTFTRGANQTVNEDSPTRTVNNWATNINPGPNESTQTRTFVTDNNNPDLFTGAGQPAISSTGTLTYTPAPNAFGTAIVTVSLVDNGGTDNGGVDTSAVQTFTITVSAVNDAPTLTLPGAQTTQEDTTISFSGLTAIQLTDIDSGNNPIQLRLSVTNGTILLPSTNGLNVSSGANGSRTVTFTGTVADIIAALASVEYTPNPAFNGTDSLSVTVNDNGFFGSGGPRSATGTIPITITSVNNPPQLISLGELVVSERNGTLNTSNTISNTLLRTTDVDNPAGQISYTLADTPDFGSLRLSSGAGVVTLNAGSFFTQADIDAGRLNYIQNGSESTSDSFSFRVSDGQIVITPDSTFNITILPANDPPGQSVNTTLALSEGEAGTIDSTFLQFTDNDTPSNQLTYTVTSAPSSGILRLGGTDLTTGSTFTQDQIDVGLLTYEQNGSETTADNFNFLVGDGTSSTPGSFNISVQQVNDPPTVISRGPITVNEGAQIPVGNTILNTSDPDTQPGQIVYTISGAPIFGSLLRNGVTTLGANATFTQAEINSGAISYRHNGGENATDVFVFNVSDGSTSTSDIVNINVTPVNDPPRLVSNTGLTLNASVPTTRSISNSQLRGTDVDNTAPEQVLFRLTSVPNPSIGVLRLDTTTLGVGQTFSQRDINQGRVRYQYLGNGTSDGFQFTLVDSSGATGGGDFFRITFTS